MSRSQDWHLIKALKAWHSAVKENNKTTTHNHGERTKKPVLLDASFFLGCSSWHPFLLSCFLMLRNLSSSYQINNTKYLHFLCIFFFIIIKKMYTCHCKKHYCFDKAVQKELRILKHSVQCIFFSFVSSGPSVSILIKSVLFIISS